MSVRPMGPLGDNSFFFVSRNGEVYILSSFRHNHIKNERGS